MLYAYLLSYSFLTKSAKLKQEANKGIDETSYSFLTKSAKLKQLKKGARIK